MRTTGTFQDIYKQAKEYLATGYITIPDPVIRIEKEKWIIESKMETSENTEYECTMDYFQSYFYDSMQNIEYIPQREEIINFIETLKE